MQRNLLMVALASMLLAVASNAAALTEAEAVQRGMAQARVQTLFEARHQISAAESRMAGRWQNPELELVRERVGSITERSVWIRQRVNLTGVRGFERDAAGRRRAAETARIALAARELRTDIRQFYYEALAAEETAQAVHGWTLRLTELIDAVAERVAAGDAARFDLLRLERERDWLHSEALANEQALASAYDLLFATIGAPTTRLDGVLLPPALADASTDTWVDGHPLLGALVAEADGAALDAAAHGRRAWPDVTLSVGHRELTEPGLDASGMLWQLSVEMPLFNRAQEERRAAEGRERALRAEHALVAQRLAAQARQAQRAVAAHRAAALDLKRGLRSPADSLAAIADAAYAAGEIGMTELLDAHRSELALRRESIERALDARKAYVEWQLLTGDE
jgi:outer membrane protein, heavy metal efflux system